jgi:hypothetical protein
MKKTQKQESSDRKVARAQIALLSATIKLRHFVDQFERVVISLHTPKPKRRKRKNDEPAATR